MKKKTLNDKLYIVLVILFVLLSSVFIREYINKEKKEYDGYNDFSRADIVMTLSYNKDAVLQFHAIRYVQLFSDCKKTSKGDLVYDFATYDFIPILNYLNESNESEKLVTSFSGIMQFLVDYNSATIAAAEDMLVEQPNGRYFKYENKKYIYETKKEVISKKAFIKMYKEYLETINYNDTEENFINKLLKNKDISSKYTYKEIEKSIQSNYNKFYKENEQVIISVISSDLDDFVKFLYTDYMFIDELNNDKRYLLKDVETDTLEVSFKFTKGDRIHNSASKYYTHNYVLDIYDVWEQLREKGYPMLYS